MSENAIFLESQTSSSEGIADGSARDVPSLQTLGAILRDRRESADIALTEVEKATRIRQKYLAAIEADEWHLLPGEVVGRGFLRNYAYFLNLDPNQMIDRRRAMVDNSLSHTLASTSAGVRLPPVRTVDYRPKDVDLEHTPLSVRISEYVESGRDWLAPILAACVIVFIVVAVGWGIGQVSGQVGGVLSTLQERISSLTQRNPFNRDQQAGGPDAQNGDEQGAGQVATMVIFTPTATPMPSPTATNTPVPSPTPTETPRPSPTATETPIPLPTATPSAVVPVVLEAPPEPEPAIVPVKCADSRLAILSPGVNQTVSGVVPIIGRAVHERFQYYKLEFAPGTNAGDGFSYFTGSETDGVKGPPVENGLLGNFNSAGMANGPYTLMLTVVDITSNYLPPCRVTVNVQN